MARFSILVQLLNSETEYEIKIQVEYCIRVRNTFNRSEQIQLTIFEKSSYSICLNKYSWPHLRNPQSWSSQPMERWGKTCRWCFHSIKLLSKWDYSWKGKDQTIEAFTATKHTQYAFKIFMISIEPQYIQVFTKHPQYAFKIFMISVEPPNYQGCRERTKVQEFTQNMHLVSIKAFPSTLPSLQEFFSSSYLIPSVRCVSGSNV